MANVKNIILKKQIEGVIYELMVKTVASQVFVDDNTTLAAKLSSIMAEIATKANTEEMTAALAGKAAASHTHEQSEINGLVDLLATLATSQSVTDAVDALRQEMLGDTPVEAYNTFTEMAQYIAEHQEVSDALTEAIGNKADKATSLAGYGITDAYTKTEVDQKIADAVSDATGGESAASVKSALEAYQTSNNARVKAIEDDYLKAADKSALETAFADADEVVLGQAKTYADGLAANYDAKGSAAQALTDAKAYADGLAGNYDAAGAAATAEQNAKTYAEEEASAAETNAKAYADGLAGNYDSKGSAAQALTDAKAYADGLAKNYDAAGSAATAEQNAKDYADGLNTAMDERMTAAETSLAGKARVLASATVPADLTEQDLWIQIVE